MKTLSEIAQSEFGLEYNQLGKSEKEWCHDELENQIIKKKIK